MTHKKLRAKYFWFQFIFGLITVGVLYTLAYFCNANQILPKSASSSILIPVFCVLFFVILLSVKFSVKYRCPGCKSNILQESGDFCKHCGFDLSEAVKGHDN